MPDKKNNDIQTNDKFILKIVSKFFKEAPVFDLSNSTF